MRLYTCILVPSSVHEYKREVFVCNIKTYLLDNDNKDTADTLFPTAQDFSLVSFHLHNVLCMQYSA